MNTLSYAPHAWRFLNGVFCIYKPSEIFMIEVRKTLAFNLCRDLNEMEKRKPQNLVLLKGSVSTNNSFSVELAPNYADHELVSGPRYQVQDLRMRAVSQLGKYSCGVSVIAINDGCRHVSTLESNNCLRKYEVKAKFGLASDTFMFNGKIVERSTYSHIQQNRLDRLLASIQSSHQALAYKYSGVDIHSQEAYDLASKGIVRPSGKSEPIIYGMKCTEFDLPNFTLEIYCVNETEVFLAEMVHQIGIYMKSCAVCTQLRRTQYGHFTLDHVLLRKHWTLENILNNITLCQSILGQDMYIPESAHFDAVKVSRLKEAVQDIQNKSRDDVL